MAQLVKNPPVTQKTCVQSLGWEDLLEKGIATHSSILAWRIQFVSLDNVFDRFNQPLLILCPLEETRTLPSVPQEQVHQQAMVGGLGPLWGCCLQALLGGGTQTHSHDVLLFLKDNPGRAKGAFLPWKSLLHAKKRI